MKFYILKLYILFILVALAGCSGQTGSSQEPLVPEGYEVAVDLTYEEGTPMIFRVYTKGGDPSGVDQSRFQKWINGNEFVAWWASFSNYNSDAPIGQNAPDQAKREMETLFAGWDPVLQAEDLGGQVYYQPLLAPDGRLWLAVHDRKKKSTFGILFPRQGS